MFKNTILSGALMSGVLSVIVGMAHADVNLVSNGDFEIIANTTVIAPGQVLAGDFPGWDTDGQLIDVFTGSRVGTGSGQYSAGFNDGRPGTGSIGTARLFQTIPTVVGGEYSFSFDYGIFNLGISDDQTIKYSISGAGIALSNKPFKGATASTPAGIWVGNKKIKGELVKCRFL